MVHMCIHNAEKLGNNGTEEIGLLNHPALLPDGLYDKRQSDKKIKKKITLHLQRMDQHVLIAKCYLR